MFARRYMHEYGATSEDFGRVAVADRKHAATNPKAWFYGKPITLEEHQASRWIVEPLHLLDCCQETDGGQAHGRRQRRARQGPAAHAGRHRGARAGRRRRASTSMVSYYRDDMPACPRWGSCAGQLWAQSASARRTCDAAIIYDHFTPFVLQQLEEFGFCGRGEAKDFIADGNIELGGALPVNTHGGQLGEAYLHGMNGIAEGVRLVAGAPTSQPARRRTHVLVTAGVGVPTSALILSAEG